MESHPLRMRGLKLSTSPLIYVMYVASFTDAWIETTVCVIGLIITSSHPLRMRGLKLINSVFITMSIVASFTDAWIETDAEARSILVTSRILYGCVD